MKNNLPTFAEWLQENDPQMLDEISLRNLGIGLGTAATGIGLWAGSHFMGNKPTPTPAPTSITQTAEPKQTPKFVPPAQAQELPQATPKKGKTFNMKGGHSGFADLKTTIERPDDNTWVFTMVGEVKPRDAIKQAKDIVQDELGAKTQNGLGARFQPTEDGMVVTITFVPAHQRQRALEGN